MSNRVANLLGNYSYSTEKTLLSKLADVGLGVSLSWVRAKIIL